MVTARNGGGAGDQKASGRDVESERSHAISDLRVVWRVAEEVNRSIYRDGAFLHSPSVSDLDVARKAARQKEGRYASMPVPRVPVVVSCNVKGSRRTGNGYGRQERIPSSVSTNRRDEDMPVDRFRAELLAGKCIRALVVTVGR